MGQCQNCLSRTFANNTESSQDKRMKGLGPYSRRESGDDSGHSSAESMSPNRDSRNQRCSQSSESSGKFSFRGSISSPGDPETCHKYTFSDSHPKSIIKGNQNDDLPVFAENGEEAKNISEVQEHPIRRKRDSISSVGSLGQFFFRNRTMKWTRSTTEDDNSSKGKKNRHQRRTVSLRLPKSRHRKDFETKVPTVYIDDEESLKITEDALKLTGGSRKSSVRKALSLLSLNSLNRDSATSRKPQKPVQRILRHPAKRHTTVRGISGLAIDTRSRADYRSGLHRAHTMVYYPTNTSLKNNLRPSYSNISYS